MTNRSRRQVLKVTAVAGASLPLYGLINTRVLADEGDRVDPEGTTARSLSYVHESPDPERNCANCQLYSGEAGAEWGPCTIFPGKQVAARGWCSAWVQRAG